MITGLNHITLAVSDLDRALQFYCDILDATAKVRWKRGAYLQIGNGEQSVWLCLSLGPVAEQADYSHIAFSVSEDQMPAFRARLASASAPVKRWQENVSEGDSVYFCDPDGHKLEVHVGNLATRLASLRQLPFEDLEWL